jgi:hypothetical protein
MYYHALARILGGHQVWTNLSLADLIRDVLVPFLNRQSLPVGYDRSRAVMNLGMVTYLRIFRTSDVIAPGVDAIQELTSARFAASECTEDVLSRARLDYAWHEARSVLQATLAPLIHRVFVVMRFGEQSLDEMYRDVIRPVAREFGYEVLRSDEVEDSEDITAQTLQALARSELILCELTDERPNCYYETGFAYALGRELILVIRRGEKKHFDIAPHRFIEWSSGDELAAGLRRRFEAIRQRRTEERKDQESGAQPLH